jgi:hypothetical protein
MPGKRYLYVDFTYFVPVFFFKKLSDIRYWNKTMSKASHKQMQITKEISPFASELLPAYT